MDAVEEHIYTSFTQGSPCPEMGYANPIITRIKEIVGEDEADNHLHLLNMPKCGVGRNTLNVDLQGNCYLCHNSSVKIGTIKDSYEKLVENFLPYDKYAASKQCSECPVRLVCSGGCILVNDEARKRYYCKMNRIFFGAVIQALLKTKSR